MKLLLLALVLIIQYRECSSAALDYREEEITVPIASSSSTRKNVGFRSFGPLNGVDGDFLTWVHTVPFERKSAWFKLDLHVAKVISKVLIVNRFLAQLEFSGFMCGMMKRYYKNKDCVGAIDGVRVAVHKDGKEVYDCGTIKGTIGYEMEEQFYYLDCGNTEGDVIMVTRDDAIAFTDITVYQFTDGVESEVPMPLVSMNTWRPVDMQDGHDFTSENAIDKNHTTFIHTIVNPRVESYFKFEIGSERSISRVEVVNRFFDALVDMNLPCGLMAFYSDTFCVGHINGLRAEVWNGDVKQHYCGTIKGGIGESLEDQTYKLDCGGARGNTVMLIRKIVVIFVEMRVYERISLKPDPAAKETISALDRSIMNANWLINTRGLISAGYRPVVTGSNITKKKK